MATFSIQFCGQERYFCVSKFVSREHPQFPELTGSLTVGPVKSLIKNVVAKDLGHSNAFSAESVRITPKFVCMETAFHCHFFR